MLVLDDEQPILKIFKIIAIKKGWRFLGTDDGTKALELLIDNDADVIFSDINMPNKTMQGYEFVKYVRESGSQVPIYMITGAATPEERQVALDNGAQDIIPKPFNAQKIMGILDLYSQ